MANSLHEWGPGFKKEEVVLTMQVGLLSKKASTKQCLVCSYLPCWLSLDREAGLSCVEVPGFGRSPGSRGGRWCQQQKSSHMWNAVELEGQWCLLDACWGAGTVDEESRLFMPR